MTKYPVIRNIYLYLFALIGLVLIVIGVVGFIEMGLKAYVFTKADQDQWASYKMPLSSPIPIEEIKKAETAGKKVEVTAEQQQALQIWAADYTNWEKQQKEIDYVVVNRQREAAKDLAFVIVGLPLYLFHWLIIRKESKNLTVA